MGHSVHASRRVSQAEKLDRPRSDFALNMRSFAALLLLAIGMAEAKWIYVEEAEDESQTIGTYHEIGHAGGCSGLKSPCGPTGRCKPLPKGYRCKCYSDYKGPHCETRVYQPWEKDRSKKPKYVYGPRNNYEDAGIGDCHYGSPGSPGIVLFEQKAKERDCFLKCDANEECTAIQVSWANGDYCWGMKRPDPKERWWSYTVGRSARTAKEKELMSHRCYFKWQERAKWESE